MIYRLIKDKIQRKPVFVFFAIAALILVVFTPPGMAEDNPKDKSKWEFEVAPYMWFLTLDGDVTVKGRKADVDMDFSDIWDEFNIGVMVAFEAQKGNWGFYSDIIYANLGKKSTVGNIVIDPNIDTLWVHFGGFYELGKWNLSDAPGKSAKTMTLDGLVGGRFTYLEMSLDFTGIEKVKGDQSWVEPVVGARTFFDLSERWTLSLEGSIGGFGAGSDFAWSAYGGFGYRFGLFSKEKHARAVAGYRALSQDYTNGSGSDKFEWDVTLQGPILGLVINF